MLSFYKMASKKVQFTDGIKDTDPSFPLTNPSSAKLRRDWLQHSCKEEYDQLRQKLEVYKRRGGTLNGFVAKEGEVLLSWALIDITDPKAMKFIVENIPKKLIQAVLEKEDYDLLHTFLSVESNMEREHGISKKGLESRIQKIRLLADIDVKNIAILKKSISDVTLTDSLRAVIKEILKDSITRNNFAKPTSS